MSRLLKLERKHAKEYRSFLENKSIAIVGPASSVMFEENGVFIDSHDVIVRINKGVELAKRQDKAAYIGGKTDVLYNSLDFNPLSGGNLDNLDLEGIKFICCPYAAKERTFGDKIFYSDNESYFEKFKIRFIDEDTYYSSINKTNSRLNSGFGAILDILDMPIKSLYITGVDFYRSVYQDEYNTQRNWGSDYKKIEDDLEFKIFDDDSHHNPDRQFKYFKELIQNNNKIRLDKFMKKIICDKRYDNWETIPRSYLR